VTTTSFGLQLLVLHRESVVTTTCQMIDEGTALSVGNKIDKRGDFIYLKGRDMIIYLLCSFLTLIVSTTEI
jgi:hypothetical protein